MTAPVVTIRPVEDDDLPILYQHQSDPVAAAMAVFPIRTPEAFFEHWALIRTIPTAIQRTVLADELVDGNIPSGIGDNLPTNRDPAVGNDHLGFTPRRDTAVREVFDEPHRAIRLAVRQL